MINVLITGANSFVGKSFAENSRYSSINEVCLLTNKLEDLDFSGIDVIIHVAAIVHQTKSIPEKTYFEVNRDLAVNVANKAKKDGVKQFVFISTVKVFGELNTIETPWNEESTCHPADPYGKSKLAAEFELQKLNSTDFTISIIRPPLLYGIGVKANMLSLIKLIDRIPILPLGGIKNKRSMTSIENLIQLIDLVVDKKAQGIFLALDANTISTSELADIIKKALNKNTLFFKLPPFLKWVMRLIIPGFYNRLFGTLLINNSMTCEKLNYTPLLSTEEGIRKMVNKYLSEKSKN